MPPAFSTTTTHRIGWQVVRDAKFDLEGIAVACDNDLGPYENILLQVKPHILL